MSGQRGSKICDREQLRNISHFKVSFNWGALMRHSYWGEVSRWGTEDPGRLGGICCGKFSPLKRFGPSILRAESECTSRGTNQMLPRTLRLPQCSLEWGPLSPLLPFTSDRWGRNVRTPTSPLIFDSLIRNGSIQDLDQGFLGMTARAFGALRAAPLLSRTLRESDKIGESAWRLWRAHRVMGSILDTCRFLGFRRVVWIKILVRLSS